MADKKLKNLTKQRALYLGEDEDEVLRAAAQEFTGGNVNTLIRKAVMKFVGAEHVFEATEQNKKDEHAIRAVRAQQARWNKPRKVGA